MEKNPRLRRKLWSDTTLSPLTPPYSSSKPTNKSSERTSSPTFQQLKQLYSHSQTFLNTSLSPISSPADAGEKGRKKNASSEDSLLLNFVYETTRNLLSDFSGGSFLSSSSSSSEDSQQIPLHLQLYRKRTQKLKTDFSKYLPAPLSSLNIPKILLNVYDKKEYEEAQDALQVLAPQTSMSDSFLGRGVQKKRTSQLSSLGSVIACCGVEGDVDEEEDSEQEIPSYFPESYLKALPKISDPRFNFTKNVAYCQLNSDPKVEFSALLYAQISEKPNYYVCHVQTELAVSGMLSFLHPWKDVQVLWVKDIRGQITDLMESRKYFPKFTEVVYLKRFEAVLVVSYQAGRLLRHGKLAFLQSLATILGISPNRLLVLSKKDSALGTVLPMFPKSYMDRFDIIQKQIKMND